MTRFAPVVPPAARQSPVQPLVRANGARARGLLTGFRRARTHSVACYHPRIVTLWLLAFKLDQPVLSTNSYALAVLNTDPDDFGLSKTPLVQHCFPTVGAVTRFVTANCKQEEVGISELEQQLGERRVYAMKVSKESAAKMGFTL